MKCCFSNLVETTQRSVEGYQFIGPLTSMLTYLRR